MDPLSDVLALLKPRSYMCSGIDSGGPLSVQFPQHEGIKCYAVVSGQRWLCVEGVKEPLRLSAGDCFVLPHGRAFTLTSDLNLTPVDFLTFLPQLVKGRIGTINGGGECLMLAAHFTLSGPHASLLLGVLPPIIHLRKESDRAALFWALERMMQEMQEQQPGSQLIAQHIAQMLLVQALRLHMAEGAKGGVGWLFALSDPQIGEAIKAMHEAPSHRWTIQQLAQLATMSRSTFALRFKERVGDSPMEYLTRWRMLVAGDRLANTGEPTYHIAMSLGYESESAFSTAFKRVIGCSPRQYRRQELLAA